MAAGGNQPPPRAGQRLQLPLPFLLARERAGSCTAPALAPAWNPSPGGLAAPAQDLNSCTSAMGEELLGKIQFSPEPQNLSVAIALSTSGAFSLTLPWVWVAVGYQST